MAKSPEYNSDDNLDNGGETKSEKSGNEDEEIDKDSFQCVEDEEKIPDSIESVENDNRRSGSDLSEENDFPLTSKL